MIARLTNHLALLTDLGELGVHDPEPEPLVFVPLLPVLGVKPSQGGVQLSPLIFPAKDTLIGYLNSSCHKVKVSDLR